MYSRQLGAQRQWARSGSGRAAGLPAPASDRAGRASWSRAHPRLGWPLNTPREATVTAYYPSTVSARRKGHASPGSSRGDAWPIFCNEARVVFPVIRSRLSSQAALTVVADAYDSCDARTRSPLVRGLNVTYHVGTDAPSYTLRACRAHWRTTGYIHCKLELVCYLGERGAAVSTAISRRDHSLTASVVAPEDHRYNGLQPHHSPRRPRPRSGSLPR